MSDEFDFDAPDVDGELDPMSFDGGVSETGEREATSVIMGKSALEGVIGAATDNVAIAKKVKKALPPSISENWDTADELIDAATRSKDNIINPIRKEIFGFKRNINKLSPLVKNYLGEGIGSKFDELTSTGGSGSGEDIDPNTQELNNTIAGIFNEESKQRIDEQNKKLVWDMMERQTEEDRFKLQLTTMHDMMSAMKSVDTYNKSVTYSFQMKSLEYDIKRFHLLRQILEVNKSVGEASTTYLKSIVHNTGLPELVKQRSSELFQQMFVEKWYGDTLDGVIGQSRNMMKGFGKNLMARASSTADTIVDSMRQVGELAEMVGDATEGQYDEDGPKTDPKEELLKMGGKMVGGDVVSRLMDSLIKEVNEKNKDKDWYKNLVAQSDNVARNKNMFFKTFIEDMANAEGGLKGMMSPIFKILEEELPSNRREMTSIGHLNSFKPTDPRQWDQQQRTTVVDIIPGWLERIHNLIAAMGGNSVDIAYDDKSGGFISKDILKQNILDRITTDSERTEALAEVDTLIDSIGKDVGNIGDDERSLLREWLVREASTTADLDIRKLLDAKSFEGLNSHDSDVADTISGALNQVYNQDTLYRVNKNSISETESNRHISTIDKTFKNVVRKYSDDQEVINDSITGGRRSLLTEMGILRADGTIDENRILKHKLMGISPSDSDSSALSKRIKAVRDNEVEVKSNTPKFNIPTSDQLPKDTSTTIPPANGPPRDELIDLIDSASPEVDGAVLSSMPQLLTEAGFKAAISDAVIGIQGINTNTGSILDTLQSGTGGKDSPRVNPKVSRKERLIDENVQVREYLSSILTTLATIHKANVSYYENVKNFDSGEHSLGDKVRRIVGSGLDFFSGGLEKGASMIRGIFGLGTKPLKAIRDGFSEAFNFEAADVYVGDETTARVEARDFRHRKMYLRDNGVILDTPVRRPEDIIFELVDEDENIIISQADIDAGNVRFNRKGRMHSLGSSFGKLVGMGVDMLTGSVGISGSIFGKAKEFVGRKIDAILNKFKDIYVVGEDGKKKLLATLQDFKDGKILVEIDGEMRTVKSLSDLYRGNIYRMGADGKLSVIATVDDIKRGLMDIEGVLVEKGSELFGKIKEGAFSLGGKAIGLAKLPFTVFGNMWTALKAKFEAKVLEKIVLNIPKDIMISANVVYLNDRGDRKGRAHKMGGGVHSNKDTTNRTKKHPFASPEEAAKPTPKDGPKDDTAIIKAIKDKYDTLIKSGRTDRAAAVIKGAIDKHPKLKTVIEKDITGKVNTITDAVSSIKDDIVKDGPKETITNVINKASNSAVFKEGIIPDTAKAISDKIDTVRNSTDDGAKDTFFNRLKNSPNALRDVIDDQWKLFISKGESDVSKEEFTNSWLDDKYGADAASVKEVLRTTNKLSISKLSTIISKINPFSKSPNDGTDNLGGYTENKPTVKDTLKLDTKEGELSDKDKNKIVNDRADVGTNPLRELTAILTKSGEKVLGDTDGDGIREGSIKDILKKRAERKKAKLEQVRQMSSGDKADKKGGMWGLLLSGIGLLASGIARLTSGIGSIGKAILSVGWDLGVLVGKGAAQVIVPLLGGLLKGGKYLAGAALSGAGTLLTKGTTVGKNVISAVGKSTAAQAVKSGAKIAASYGIRKGAMALGAVALAATPVGWALGVASVCWTVWEVSSGVFGIWDRRKDIKVMEFLRHLQYGMVSGDEGAQHLSKISLRYFEGEIMSEAVVEGDIIKIGMTTQEVWDKYRGDFEDGGDDANHADFVKWYEHRFLPVLYKWMSLVHAFNGAYKDTQSESYYGSKFDLALLHLDDKLTDNLKVGMARQAMIFGELDFDPLNAMYSPSTAVRCVAGRPECQAYVDKIEEFFNPTVIDGSLEDSSKKTDETKVGASLPQTIAEKAKAAAMVTAKNKLTNSSIYPNSLPEKRPLDPITSDILGGKTDEVPSNYVMKVNSDGTRTLDNVNPGSSGSSIENFIMSKEGFSAKAYRDHGQYSIGYGTRTDDPREQSGILEIDKSEAKSRLSEWIANDRKYIVNVGEAEGLEWAPEELDALTSFTYNLGRSNLKQLIRNRTKADIARIMPKYNKVEGITSIPILKRRLEEVSMFESGADDKVNRVADLIESPVKKDADIPVGIRAPEIMGVDTPDEVVVSNTVTPLRNAMSKSRTSKPTDISEVTKSSANEPQVVKVDVSGMSDNSDVTNAVNSGNTIANNTLKVQRDTQSAIADLVKVLSSQSGGGVKTASVAPIASSQPNPPVRNTVVPSNSLTINPKSKYS